MSRHYSNNSKNIHQHTYKTSLRFRVQYQDITLSTQAAIYPKCIKLLVTRNYRFHIWKLVDGLSCWSWSISLHPASSERGGGPWHWRWEIQARKWGMGPKTKTKTRMAEEVNRDRTFCCFAPVDSRAKGQILLSRNDFHFLFHLFWLTDANCAWFSGLALMVCNCSCRVEGWRQLRLRRFIVNASHLFCSYKLGHSSLERIHNTAGVDIL